MENFYQKLDENSAPKMDAGVQTESEINIAAMNGKNWKF